MKLRSGRVTSDEIKPKPNWYFQSRKYLDRFYLDKIVKNSSSQMW